MDWGEPKSLEDWLVTPLPPVKLIIGDGILIEQAKMVLYGVFKSGKSTMVDYIAMCLAGGIPLFGKPEYRCEKSKVLVLQLEMPHVPFMTRLMGSQLAGLSDVRKNLMVKSMPFLKLADDQSFNWLSTTIKKHKPDVLVIDPIYKMMTGDENNARDVTDLTDRFDTLMTAYGFSLIMTHQSRKQTFSKDGAVDTGEAEIRGSTALLQWVDTIIGVRKMTDPYRKVSITKRWAGFNGIQPFTEETVCLDLQTGMYKTK